MYYLFLPIGFVLGLLVSIVLIKVLWWKLGTSPMLGIFYTILGLYVTHRVTKIFQKLTEPARFKLIAGKLAAIDASAWIPAKILSVVVVVCFLSQTLLFLPLSNTLFIAQGSTIILNARKLVRDMPSEKIPKGLFPDQFSNTVHFIDPAPITFNSIRGNGEYQDVVDSVAPSVVKILSEGCLGTDSGSGTGFFVAPHFIATNAHVISSGQNTFIKTTDGIYPATPRYMNSKNDVAILYSEYVEGTPLPLIDGEPTSEEELFYIGYPLGGDLQVAFGHRREEKSAGEFRTLDDLTDDDYFEMDIGAQPGSSGSPVVNLDGAVVGLLNSSGAGANAIDASYVKPLIDKAGGSFIAARSGLCNPLRTFRTSI